MISGARQARLNFFRRLVARAQARELAALVVPDPEAARTMGVDLEAAGLRTSFTPRHADVLVLTGELPPGLKKAAAVAYAQMPRPRAILAVGAGHVSPLPEPNVSVGTGQEDVAAGVAELRRIFARSAFSTEAADFDLDAVRTQTEYVCPMHPQVVRSEPDSCPICGMDLVPREAAGGNGHGTHHEGMDHGGHDGGAGASHGEHEGHDEHAGMERGEQDEGHEQMDQGSDDEGEGQRGHEGMDHGEMSGMGYGGMSHDGMDHGGHGGMDHGDMGFMSMVEMTQGTPRSSDGLQMEWAEDMPFGPLFPGLPGGLALTLTLDGDTVARAEAEGVEGWAFAEDLAGPAEALAGRLARLDPLSPVAYRVLAWRALESAAGVEPGERTALARVGALEKERASSHMGWLSLFGRLIGYSWLESRAGTLQLALARAVDADEVARLRGDGAGLARRVEWTPLLRRKLGGVGILTEGSERSGPVARGAGVPKDARTDEEVYRSLGFEPVVRDGDDALSRLRVRLAEVEQSLDLVGKAGETAVPELAADPKLSSAGSATVETPRGAAALRVTLEGGAVEGVELDTPSARHLALVRGVAEQQELADALVAVASLDLSPWGVDR